jgi:peptidoglycan/xylan/chitin deacetylase (PgdA/CDA1 family)
MKLPQSILAGLGLAVALLLPAALTAPLEARVVEGDGSPRRAATPTPMEEIDENLGVHAFLAEQGGWAAATPLPPPNSRSRLVLPTVAPEDLANFAIPPLRILRGDKTLPRVALTFDTGQGTPVVQLVLDELRAANVRATFFIVGRWAEQNPQVVRALAAAGHELANHSYSHPNFDLLSDDQMLAQVALTEKIIRQETGCTTRPFFRPPFGSASAHTMSVVAEAGFETIMWSAHGGDWLSGATTETIHARVLRYTGDGTIVILHSSVPYSAQALPMIIADLRARGFELVTLGELLSNDPAQPPRANCQGEGLR